MKTDIEIAQSIEDEALDEDRGNDLRAGLGILLRCPKWNPSHG